MPARRTLTAAAPATGAWRLLLLCAALLAGCATPPPPQPEPVADLLDDALFAAPSVRIDPDDALAVSDDMRQHVVAEFRRPNHGATPQQRLVDAVRKRGTLTLEYDAAHTRNASEAYAARSGNCLSLVLMVAALAREMGLQVTYQRALIDDTWSRSGELVVRSGHVNLTLSRSMLRRTAGEFDHSLTIDFLAPEDLSGLKIEPLHERTVVAMFLNNRAAEALVDGHIDDAYGWARAAVRQDSRFLAAYNTLGLVYMRKGAWPQAARVFARVLEQDPTYVVALANQTRTLRAMGRNDEADAMARRLAAREAQTPFQDLQLGLAAYRQGNYTAARDAFQRELQRGDGYHEVYYWLAVTELRLGDTELARRHLQQAQAVSVSRSDRALYAAKLARLGDAGATSTATTP